MSWVTDNTPYQYGRFVAGYNDYHEDEEIQWVIQETRTHSNGSVLELEEGWVVEESGGIYSCEGEESETLEELLKKVAEAKS